MLPKQNITGKVLVRISSSPTPIRQQLLIKSAPLKVSLETHSLQQLQAVTRWHRGIYHCGFWLLCTSLSWNCI